MAERQEGVRRADVPSDKGVGEDRGADVVVVVKKRKKSKKGKGSGRKEGEKRKTSKAASPSPEPEEQGRQSVCRQRPRAAFAKVRSRPRLYLHLSIARTRSFMHSLSLALCVSSSLLSCRPRCLSQSLSSSLSGKLSSFSVFVRERSVSPSSAQVVLPAAVPSVTLLPSHAVHCEVVSHVAVRGAATENSFPPRCFRIRRSILPPH